MINFYFPYSSFLFLISLYILYRYIKNKNNHIGKIPFPKVTSFLKKYGNKGHIRSHWSFFIKFIILNLMILAFMRPQYFSKNDFKKVSGINIIIALDISTSMLAQDIKPQRLQVAKKVIQDFISKRNFDRIGLVAYAGDAYLLSPFTTDQSILTNAIKQVDFDEDIEQGTAIGNAVALSVDRLKEKVDETKIIILVSDGSNNMGEVDPQIAADIASAYNIKIYSIGIGKPGYSMVPITLKDKNGRTYTRNLPVEMNEKVLKNIAKKTGGLYFNAQSLKKLKEIYKKIDQYEKTDIEQLSNNQSKEIFPYILILILSLLFLEIIVSQTILRTLP